MFIGKNKSFAMNTKNVFLMLLLLLISALTLSAQTGKVITGGGSGGGWLKDSLQAGRVSIDAPGNTLSLTSLDSFRVRATEILLWVDDSLNIKIDSSNSNNEIVVNNRLTIDKDGIIEMWGYDKTFDAGYGPTDNGKITYNSTDGVPMFRNNTEWVNLATETDISDLSSAGNGGIYGGSGNLPSNVRASGTASEYSLTFDSIGIFQIKDWNEGQALRIVQDFSGVTKFGRGITYVGAADSLDISYTEAGANSLFTIDATKPIHIDAKSTVINPDSSSFSFGTLTLTDNRAGLGGATHGIKYAADYSSGFVSRSLVDKAYCDGNAAGPTAKYCVVGDQSETLQNVNGGGSSNWEIFPTASQVVNQGSSFSFNTGTDRITYTASASGYVRIWFHFSFDTNSLANEFNVSIKKNGTETRAKSTVMANESGINFAGSSETYISVSQNDYFEIGGYFTGSAANMNLHELMWGVEFVGE